MTSLLRRSTLCALVALLMACAPVSLFFNGKTSDRFGNVWVNINSVWLERDDGPPVWLYGEPDGTVVNVNDVEDIAQLLSLRNIPEGSYTSLHLVLNNAVTLTDDEGETQEVELPGDSGKTRYIVPCLQTFTDDEPAAIAIEFDLNELVVNGDELDMSGALGCLKSRSVAKLAKNTARWRGTVKAVLDETSFVLGALVFRMDVDLTVELGEAGVIFDEASGESTEDTSALNPGDHVRVFGGFDFTSFRLAALSVSIKSPEGEGEEGEEPEEPDDDAVPGGRGRGASMEVTGEVLAYEGSELLIAVTDADFMPPEEALSVAGITDARFQRGSLDLLAVGQTVELRGSWDGSVYTVKFVNIEGASPGQSKGNGDLVQLRGDVVSADGTVLTIDVKSLKPLDGDTPEEMIIDVAEAYLARGHPACLVAGARLSAWGIMSEDVFEPSRVQILGKCEKPEEEPVDVDPVEP